jgi:hypothetical protein
VNFLRETPPGFFGMVNGWLSRGPRENPGAGRISRFEHLSRRRRETPASDAIR